MIPAYLGSNWKYLTETGLMWYNGFMEDNKTPDKFAQSMQDEIKTVTVELTPRELICLSQLLVKSRDKNQPDAKAITKKLSAALSGWFLSRDLTSAALKSEAVVIPDDV